MKLPSRHQALRAETFQISDKFRLIVEQHQDALSAAVGLFVSCGSRHEEPSLHGATHLTEHFVFKGTTKYSSDDISQKIERFGGELNAFTEREYTCFHAWVPRDEIETSTQLIFEMIFDSLLDTEDFRREKGVVVQELKGYEDSAEDEFWDTLLEQPWGEHPLGRRIAGFSSPVKNFTHEDIVEFISDRFLQSPMTLVVVSHMSPERVLKMTKRVLRRCKDYIWGDKLDLVRHPRRDLAPSKRRGPVLRGPFTGRSAIRSFEADQVHLGFLYPSVSAKHPNEIQWAAATSILGAGSSSRLFREIREERGLAYAASCFMYSFSDAGLVTGYLSTEKKNWLEAVYVAGEVCRKFSEGITDDEFEFIRSNLEGSLYMSFEGVNNRMEALGRQDMLLGRTITLNESKRDLKKLTKARVNRVAKMFAQTPCLVALGPLDSRDLTRMHRAWQGKGKHRHGS